VMMVIGGDEDDSADVGSQEQMRPLSYTCCCSEALDASTSLRWEGKGERKAAYELEK
jgi:hypothetical protein